MKAESASEMLERFRRAGGATPPPDPRIFESPRKSLSWRISLYRTLNNPLFWVLLLVIFLAGVFAIGWYFPKSVDGFFSHFPSLPNVSFGFLVIGLFFYLLPSIIASKSEWLPLIFVLNLFFGWTGFVWLFCILAAVMSPRMRRA